jgi:hypothetical protein
VAGEEEAGEEEVEEEEEEEDCGDDDEHHYAVTIGHVLSDDTVHAVLSSGNTQQVVSIPKGFSESQLKTNVSRVNHEIPEQLDEIGCLLIPLGTLVACQITNVDCGGLYDFFGEERASYYPNKDTNQHCFRMLETRHVSSIC